MNNELRLKQELRASVKNICELYGIPEMLIQPLATINLNTMKNKDKKADDKKQEVKKLTDEEKKLIQQEDQKKKLKAFNKENIIK
jgi:hypothetical protein